MSLKTRGEMIIEFISFRETEIQIKLFESYLNILFDSLKSSCGFTKEVFIFLFPKIPFLIKEKFYEYIIKKIILIQNILIKKYLWILFFL